MKKTISLLMLGWILITSLSWCSNLSTSIESKWPEVVKIGVIAPLSGPAWNYGEDAINAYNYIVEKFNSSQSELEIKLVVEDGKCDGKTAASAAQKLINIDNVEVILWWICSVETVPVGKIAQSNQVTLLSPLSSAPEIAEIWNYVFRFYNDAYVTKKLSQYMADQWAKKVFVLTESTDSCLWYANAIEKNFPGVVEKQIYQSSEKDFGMIAKQIKAKLNDVDFLVFLPNSDGNVIGIIQALDKEGILESMKWRIATNELITSKQITDTLWSKTDGIKTTQLMNLESMWSKAKSLVEDFLKEHTITSDSFWIVFESEAVSLLIDAIKENWNTSEWIRDYFNNLNKNNKRKWYFGDYYFTENRDANWLDFLVYEMKDGKLVNGK